LKKEYRVERDVCTIRDISQPFPIYGALQNSQFFGSDYIGSVIKGYGIYVDNFVQELENGGRYMGQYAPIGSIGYECVPVTEAFVNLQGPYSERMNVHYEFLNITTITSFPPGAFDIPTNCITT
jgi:hypothetical protein